MKTQFSILALALALVLAACGSSGPQTSLNVSMTDFAYNPNTFRVPAGQEITLHIANNGAVVHNFIIMNAGTEIGQDFDEADQANVYWQIDIQPGGSADTSFVAPAAPGEYLVVCSTAGHYIAGMIGKLVVESP